ncbi:hypothetical protein C8J56DRAFT_1167035 [Mycena floridula]|nr:hypothetical protein C8J56DRAFT_1167035 [Mycena floridula]
MDENGASSTEAAFLQNPDRRVEKPRPEMNLDDEWWLSNRAPNSRRASGASKHHLTYNACGEALDMWDEAEEIVKVQQDKLTAVECRIFATSTLILSNTSLSIPYISFQRSGRRTLHCLVSARQAILCTGSCSAFKSLTPHLQLAVVGKTILPSSLNSRGP